MGKIEVKGCRVKKYWIKKKRTEVIKEVKGARGVDKEIVIHRRNGGCG